MAQFDEFVFLSAVKSRPSSTRSAHATLWALADLGGGQACAFVIFLVIARVIGPSQYGIFAIAMSLLSLLTILQYYGFADAIVQRADIDAGFLDTVFWSDVVLSLVLVAINQAIALPAAHLFHAPSLAPMIRVLSALSLLQALTTVQTALCRRTLRMRILAVRTLAGYGSGGIAGIVLALHGFGVWSLVAAQVVQFSVNLVAMVTAVPWRPGFRVTGSALRELLHFSGHFMLANGLKQSSDRFSQLVVGLFVAPAGVGCYAMALRVLQTAMTLAINPLERVALPVLSRFANDLPAFRRTYRQMLLVSNSIWTPAAIGLGIGAPILVPLLFGSRWQAAVPVVQAMCFTGPTLGLWFLNGLALAALGKPERFTALAVAYVALGCIAFPLASQFGIVAAGIAWSSLSLLVVPLHLRAIRKACGLSLRAVLSDWARVTASAAAMLATMLVIETRLPAGIVALIVTYVAGSLVYLVLLQFVLLPGYVGRMLALLRRAVTPKSALQREEAI